MPAFLWRNYSRRGGGGGVIRDAELSFQCCRLISESTEVRSKCWSYSGRLTSGAGVPVVKPEFRPWFPLILLDFVWSRPSFGRLSTSLPHSLQSDRSQLHVLCCTCACHFVAPIPADVDAATFDDDRCSLNLSPAFWLSPFLPSLMFKHSLQLWCLFFFVTLSSVARNASLRAASRERERERERETGWIAHWIILAFKLN